MEKPRVSKPEPNYVDLENEVSLYSVRLGNSFDLLKGELAKEKPSKHKVKEHMDSMNLYAEGITNDKIILQKRPRAFV